MHDASLRRERESLIPRMLLIGVALLLILDSASAPAADPNGNGRLPAGEGPIVSGIDIEIEEGRGDTARWESMARGMILVKAGEPFSEAALQKSLAALDDSGMFEAVHVPDPDWTADKIVLTFRLTPFFRIRAIQVAGAFPVFDREVRNALTFHSGGSYDAERIPAEEASVVDLFKSQGYIAPVVRITAEPSETAGIVDLRVRIDKGRYFRLESFAVDGNRAFSDFRLKLRTDAWKKSLLFGGVTRFVRKDLDEDVRELVKFYRAKGYADAAVDARVARDVETAAVDVWLAVEEGPRYDVSFEGNDAYWAWWTLRRDLALSTGNRNDAGLKKSLRNIRNRYRSDGYLDSRVTTTESLSGEASEKRRDIRILIDEGPRSVVEHIDIEGNTTFDDDRILKQMLTRTPGLLADGEYDPRRLKDDIGAVKALYLREGFLKTTVAWKMDWQAGTETADGDDSGDGKRYGRLAITIDEGVQTRVSSLSITGVSVVSLETLETVLLLKPGEPYREYLLKTDEDTITGIVAEKGYPYVQVKGSAALSSDGTGAHVRYTVSEGGYVGVGRIHFTGNFRTVEEILRNELEIRPDGPFSARKILESRRNIQNMGAVDSVRFRFPGLQERAETVDLIVEVEEEPPYWMEFSLGYDTERHFFAAARGGDRNFLGRNQDLRGGMEISQIGYRLEAAFTEPRFRQSRISATSTVFGEKREAFNQDFGTRNFGVSQVFSRRLLDGALDLGLAFSLERREQYMRGGSPIPEGDEELYRTRTVLVGTPSAVYNTTDSFVRPTRGVFASFHVDLSRGLQESLDDFLKYRFETRYYKTPVDRLTFAIRGMYGYIYPYGSDSVVPDDQLFYLGGTATVRGFDENLLRIDADGRAVGGRESLLGNLEVRYDLGMNLEMAAFYDVGRIGRAGGSGGSDDLRSSAGLGLRYITPIGAVGILYGWKLDPMAGEDAGRLHFSIGYTF